MNNIVELRNLFRPIQPRFKEGGQDVTYEEIIPGVPLCPYICCYWQLKTEQPLSYDFNYTAVADGCIDFVFDLGDPHTQFVMGVSSQYTTFTLERSFNYAGIRFFPGAFPALFGVNASELTNESLPIADVLPQIHQQLTTLLAGQSTLNSIKPLLDDFFIRSTLPKKRDIDLRFESAFHSLLNNAGGIKVEKTLSHDISPRHLRRLFDFYIGVAPKELNKIIRFQKFLRGSATLETLKQEKLYYDLGYYDQSHFIKDFKQLYGLSPLKAFS